MTDLMIVQGLTRDSSARRCNHDGADMIWGHMAPTSGIALGKAKLGRPVGKDYSAYRDGNNTGSIMLRL